MPSTPEGESPVGRQGMEPAAAGAGTTLRRLVETLGPPVLGVACAPHGQDVPVGPPVVYDPHAPVPERPDGVLVLVGGCPRREKTLAAIRQAGAARYGAVVLKSRGADVAAAVAAAEAAGVALLIAVDDVPWRHLEALVAASGDAASAHGAYASVGLGRLFPLADAIAARVGGPIAVEDPGGRVLAHSGTVPRPAGPAAHRRVIHADGPVRVDLPEREGRLAVAVRSGSRLLGLIWALDGDPPLGAGAPAALGEAARVAAVHLLHARGPFDPDRRTRGEVLRSLLDGALAPGGAALRLGLDAATRTSVLAITPADGRIAGLIARWCDAWHPRALSTVSSGQVYALLPTCPGDPVAAFAADVAATVRRSTDRTLHVGISMPAGRLDDVPACRRTADRVLRALAADTDEIRVARIDDVCSRLMLLQVLARGSRPPAPPPGPVRRIIAHDDRHASGYAEALLAFLDAFGEADRAADRLSVPEPVLRDRIARIRALFDLDLDDPEVRLTAWLQLRLHVS